MIWDVYTGSRVRIVIFYPFRIQRHRIPDPQLWCQHFNSICIIAALRTSLVTILALVHLPVPVTAPERLYENVYSKGYKRLSKYSFSSG